MKILRMDHLAFAVGDLEASLAFYHDLLGLACRREESSAVLSFGDGTLALRLSGSAAARSAANSAALGSQNFCFRAQGDADRLLSELGGRGARLVEPRVAVRQGALGEMRSIYLFDPDHNLVEIGVYQPSEQPVQITALDHVVLVVDELERAMEFYQNTLGMEGSADGGHGVLWAGGQKFNVHHKKPRYAPHEPYAATGSVEYRLVVEADERRPQSDGPICFRDPDGNLGELRIV